MGKVFQLVENKQGHASGATIMRFNDCESPCTATYSGPNVSYGQAIVQSKSMLYQALESDGALTAGQAKVTIAEPTAGQMEMRLDWKWLTGDRSEGVSFWQQIEIDAHEK